MKFHFTIRHILLPELFSYLLFFPITVLNAQLIDAGQEGRMAGQPTGFKASDKSGLLFSLSGAKGIKADFAQGGQYLPNFLKDVKMIDDGINGKAFQCEDDQLLSFWAPGNIYAQRGTLSFFWRSRYPVGPTPFPIFRVGYADHSSWDMTWLRIDYNGSGFDAFVTDIGLSRIRISYFMDKFPDPGTWTHIALSWDETSGIRFYVNGLLVKEQSVTGTMFDTGLDQFGPHSRIISPYQVQSAYCFMRGGDIDEIRIYDHMLRDNEIASLSKGADPGKKISPFSRDLSEQRWRDEWWTLNGWNLPNTPPPQLPSPKTVIRKVDIHDAYDIKRWFWKANDGIRETTWPGVYNMSRLPGRYDYFVLPDWDCYSGSGQSVRFILPDEKWNHVEMWGTAWGQLTYESKDAPDSTFSVRSRNSVKSSVTLSVTRTGGTIRFDNALIEEPIGSFDVFNVSKGVAPEGAFSETFHLFPFSGESSNTGVRELVAFIKGRYPQDETAMMIGSPDGSGIIDQDACGPGSKYPYLHLLIPYSGKKDSGLDGLEIQFPVMKVTATHKGLFPVNIRIKDPLWPMRDLADFSFSVKPGDSPLLWLDTRDRILPEGRALYITISGAGADMNQVLFTGVKVRLVFKPGNDALTEHIADRLTQIRDLYAHICEEHPVSTRLNLFNRYMADCNDLLSADPGNWLAKAYLFSLTGRNKPDYKLPDCPEGVPEWAFYQVEYLKKLANIANYYIDKRQISNGEFGGGLSDDGDLVNMWPAMAFMGIDPDKLHRSLKLHMEAYFDSERAPEDNSLKQRSLPLMTNGLATIFTDELHSLEDGMQVVGAMMLFDYASPKYYEKGMLTARRMLNEVTQVNSAGHRHFRSRFYGATRLATEDPWQWSVNHSYHVLQTSYLLARYNGNPDLVRMIRELADGLLAHMKNGRLPSDINFETDSARYNFTGQALPSSLFYAAWYLTGNLKYLGPLPGNNMNHRDFDNNKLSAYYKDEIRNLGIREFINTEGSIWIDRVTQFNPRIQEERLGGIAIQRINILFPQNLVSWKFMAPATFASAAIYVPDGDSTKITVIAYNLEKGRVRAEMTLWNIKPGKWHVRQGVDLNGDLITDRVSEESFTEIRQGESITANMEPGYNIISLELVSGAAKSNRQLPDLGISSDDINISGKTIHVRVHNTGALTSQVTSLVISDSNGKTVASTDIPSIEAPLDLRPRWKDISVTLEGDADLSHGMVRIDPMEKNEQITSRNKAVRW
jgi:hypothetical protein